MEVKRKLFGSSLNYIGRSLANRLIVSKKSDFNTAEYKIGSEYMEITLKPDNKKLIIYTKEISKFIKGYFYAVVKEIWIVIKSLFSRVFQRSKWINRSHFELASLVNILLSYSQISSPQKRIEKVKEIVINGTLINLVIKIVDTP